MAKREIKHPDKLVSTGSYSAGIQLDNWLFISGQGPLNLANRGGSERVDRGRNAIDSVTHWENP